MDQNLIAGVLVTPQKRILHPSGDILHALTASGLGYAGFGEAYFSTVHPGAIKGWKRHKRVTLNLVVPIGEIRFVIHDDRPGSPTQGQFTDLVLGGENYARLTVSPGVWMAFEGRSQGTNLLLNIIDEEHDPAEADNVALESFEYFKS
jgi:dTDP-4-dehydrorhamnose 3,5-epimerase